MPGRAGRYRTAMVNTAQTTADDGGTAPLAEIGVIGGSGFYSFLDDVREVQVDTPYGAPSDSLFLGEVAGRRIAFSTEGEAC